MSVATPHAPLTSGAPAHRDAGRWPSIAKLLLLAGPVLLFTGYALHPDLPEEAAAALPEVADARGTTLAAKLLVAVGSLVMIPLIVQVRRQMAARRGRSVATAGAALVTIGMASNALSQATYGYLLWWVTDPDVSRAAGVQVADVATTETAATLPVSFLAVPVFAVGLLLVAAGLWRARSVPSWASVVLGVGTIAAAALPVGWPMLVVGVPLTAAFAATLQSAPDRSPAAMAS
jgi:hypothetical protein